MFYLLSFILFCQQIMRKKSERRAPAAEEDESHVNVSGRGGGREDGSRGVDDKAAAYQTNGNRRRTL